MPKNLHYFHDFASSCSIVVFYFTLGTATPNSWTVLCSSMCELAHAFLEVKVFFSNQQTNIGCLLQTWSRNRVRNAHFAPQFTGDERGVLLESLTWFFGWGSREAFFRLWSFDVLPSWGECWGGAKLVVRVHCFRTVCLLSPILCFPASWLLLWGKGFPSFLVPGPSLPEPTRAL